MESNYFEANRQLWDQKTDAHVISEFYAVDAFKQGASSLNSIELDLLGDVRGKSILHLQCHFGQDTLSLARLGARVTGIDFSENAIGKARALAEELGLEAKFICCNVLDIDQHLNGEQFDLVFTSYGTIGWLPELTRWGSLIAQHLKPGGMFCLVEFHPVVWMFDDDFEGIAYSYFNRETIEEDIQGTYANRDAPVSGKSYSWNHGLAEVFQALLGAGLQLSQFKEFDYSPYPCFKHVVPAPNGYHIKGYEGKLPMVYGVVLLK